MPTTARYSALPNSREDEMEAAFESDDEGHDDDVARPMLSATQRSSQSSGHVPMPSTVTPGGYDFEHVYDYDYPPPGSPPRPSSTALPNDWGNSNGLVPSEPAWRPAESGNTFLQRSLRRLFPGRYARVASSDNAAPIGGGNGNDGVFANVVAKPTTARVETTPDGVHVMPEESQKDAPPSYASAQADAVPPYWETTVHAPSTSVAGEMIVDSLPTGTLFSFLWNMLISLSFSFVGFLLTYLLHTTHAAKYGSRAGLGITLLQYGFALRNRDAGGGSGAQDAWSWDAPVPTPSQNDTFVPTGDATAPTDDDMSTPMPYPQEWIAFFLMTIGWFLVLTSFLGYWRVKRWEYQILQSANAHAAQATPPSTAEQSVRDRAVRRNLEQLFGFHRVQQPTQQPDLELGPENDEALTPEERRLREDLRAAGLI